MRLESEPAEAIDLDETPVHLGLGSRASVVEGFAWDPEVLEAYVAAVADDGAEGRMVMLFDARASWTSWERHPAGEEVVICLSGRMTVTYEHDGQRRSIDLAAGQAMVNPRGAWHTADVHEPGRFLTITPGVGTEHRPR
jgi:quercetin dioxygenase-like cupin family protein